MGDPSSLRLVPASSASTPIDWTRIPEASKKFLLDGWGYDWENDEQRSLPATVGDLAKMFDESKFFGYMRPDLCTLLMDISEFGLEVQALGVPPRFYMKYLEQVWFILFLPGKREGISGYSRDVIRKDSDDISDDEEEDQRMIAKETELAQKFDLKLTREFSPAGADLVDVTNKLCGWDASMLSGDLVTAQYMTAIQTLPISHPAYRAMMQNVMSSFGNRGGSRF
jgi:hypothetical protein